jgi:hypothetical protein
MIIASISCLVEDDGMDHVCVKGYLRDAAYSGTLSSLLRRGKKAELIQGGKNEVGVGRMAAYVVVRMLVGFS